MSSFTELDARALDDGKHWKLLNPVVYHVGGLDSKDTVTIPAGFITDFGSVPRILWPIVSPHGKGKKAFIVHDWLYMTGQRSRLVADAILDEALAVCGVNWFQRRLIWRGLRIGGFVAWNEHRRREKKDK